MKFRWWTVAIVIMLLVAGIWLIRYLGAPLPGQKVADMGREHVTPQQVASTKYTSNPPTSGPHLPTWVKPGVYDAPQSEGELIHSLEHGYVIISYNCTPHFSGDIKYQISNIKNTYQKSNIAKPVYAHEEGALPSGEGSPSADLADPAIASGSAVNESDACKTLVKQLAELGEKKKLFKLIVVPRPNLDTTIALTAWGYIDAFDALDAKRIERFIDYHRDHGPEKTME